MYLDHQSNLLRSLCASAGKWSMPAVIALRTLVASPTVYAADELECYRTTDCKVDEVCLENQCVEEMSPMSCETDEDCESNIDWDNICVDGHCRNTVLSCGTVAGHCYVEEDSLNCYCFGGEREFIEIEANLADADAFVVCTEKLSVTCGETLAELPASCVGEELEICRAYGKSIPSAAHACDVVATQEQGTLECCSELAMIHEAADDDDDDDDENEIEEDLAETLAFYSCLAQANTDSCDAYAADMEACLDLLDSASDSADSSDESNSSDESSDSSNGVDTADSSNNSSQDDSKQSQDDKQNSDTDGANASCQAAVVTSWSPFVVACGLFFGLRRRRR